MKRFTSCAAALTLVLAAAAPALAGTTHLACTIPWSVHKTTTLHVSYLPSKRDVVDGKGEHYESWAVTVNAKSYPGYYSTNAKSLSWRAPAMHTRSGLYVIDMRSLKFTVAGNGGVVHGTCKGL